MKLKISEDITTEDIPSAILGVVHTAKKLSGSRISPSNVVEYTLFEKSLESFRVCVESLQKQLVKIGDDK